MKSVLALVAATALWAATRVGAQVRTSEGCYGSATGLIFNATDNFNSVGSCGDACYAQQYAVMAMTNATYCYCSQTLPPVIANASASKCSVSCPGYPDDRCGARGYFSVYLTGLTTDVTNADPGPDDKASASLSTTTGTATAVKSAIPTAGEKTVVVTEGNAVATAVPPASASPHSGGGGPSKAGIAIGVVAGVLVIAGILGGLFFFMRNRKRREIEEEYKRNAAVSSFVAGGKPPTSSAGTSSFTDMRLDPAVMAQRRMSDGSIADNQDYSRRILQVTNA